MIHRFEEAREVSREDQELPLTWDRMQQISLQ